MLGSSEKPPKADIWRPAGNVAEVPIGDMLSTPGHPIGDHLNGTYVPVEEPSTASEAEVAVMDFPPSHLARQAVV